jgi:Polyketide cyclase / dehydrase and lipid transport
VLETIVIILALLVVIVVALLGYAATKPNTVSYTRSTRINAPPEKIAALINDFKKWQAWSPWEKKDPNLKRTFSGNPSGVGSVYAWEGNKNVGSGRMEILESTLKNIRIKLDFITPFKASNTADFTFIPQGGATDVNWVMTGENLFIGKVMSVFMDFDKMIGKDFEAGLAAMKAAAESK